MFEVRQRFVSRLHLELGIDSFRFCIGIWNAFE